jgi:protein ImuB
LQFTPRVAIFEDAVVLEVEASVRLFGGKRALRDRIVQESVELGSRQAAWATNSVAALALARAGIENDFKRPLEDLLDALPLGTLSATLPHATTLAHLGCTKLGDLRRLPRGGISRRFGKELLSALDQAYGLVPCSHQWVTLPESFTARLELLHRVEIAPALLWGARRLMLQMCGWLGARHCGVTAYTLRWAHDAMRSREASAGGEITIRTAEPTRDLEHLCRLLAEHLAKIELEAPVLDLELHALDVRSMEHRSTSLLPDPQGTAESMALVLERIAARLGPERVLRPVMQEDHRLEWLVHWQPHPDPQPRRQAAMADVPQPTFVLPDPLRLACKGPRPMYQGVLQLLIGPHRVEGGWWDRVEQEGAQGTRQVTRDYWVALSEHAGVLWVFQTRLADDETAWFLHGIFA